MTEKETDVESPRSNSRLADLIRFTNDFIYTKIDVNELSKPLKIKYFLAFIFLLFSPFLAYVISTCFLSEIGNKVLLVTCLLVFIFVIAHTIMNIARNGITNINDVTASRRAINDIKAAIVEALIPIITALAIQLRLAEYNHGTFDFSPIIENMTVLVALGIVFLVLLFLFIAYFTMSLLHHLVRLPLYVPRLPMFLVQGLMEGTFDLLLFLIGLLLLPLALVFTVLSFVLFAPIVFPIMLLAQKLMRPAYQPSNTRYDNIIEKFLH